MATPINLNLVWAASGGITDPGNTKYQAGWVAEIPTFQNFNYVLNALDNNLLSYAENDIYPWQDFIAYTAGARVVRNDITYFCIQPHNDAAGSNPQDPALDTTNSYWVNSVVFSSKADAFTRLDVREGIKLEEVSPQVDANTWTGNDVTVQNKSCLTALNTTNASTENLLFGNVGGKLIVIQVGNTTLPDGRDIRPSQNANSYEIYHQGNKPTQLDVSGTIPENPQDGKLYGRRDGNWVSVSDTTVSTAPPPPVAGAGAGWFNLDDGQFYLDIDDGDSSQWVPANPPVVPSLRAEDISFDDSRVDLGSTVQEAIENLSARLDWQGSVMTREEFEAKRLAEKQARNYNSGFNEWGKVLDNSAIESINQGMAVTGGSSSLLAGQIQLGYNGSQDSSGVSKTTYAISSIAGVTSKLSAYTDNYAFRIEFPQAPNGATTYDSATGTVLDYETEVDPKYGDIAGTLNEAVARAFEGDIKNGDFRNGTTDWGSTSATLSAANGELTVTATTTSTCTANQTIAIPTVVGEKYEISGYVVSSDVGEGALIAQGIASMSVAEGEYGTLTFTATGTSTIVRVGIVGSAGQAVVFKNLSFRKITTEAVTERVDMFGCEYFLREVTQADSWVYAKGATQSQATAMNGIPTLDNAQRPQTYFDQYEGQNGSKGKGVDFWNASDEDKLAIVSDPTNNIYYDDGKVYQWCYRFRTVAGAGNGDWANVEFNVPPVSGDGNNYLMYQKGSPYLIVKPQGNYDATPAFTGSSADAYGTPSHTAVEGNNDGIFTSTDTLAAVEGECYFQVFGTANRLNQGAYHPSLNSLGASKVNYGGGRDFWYGSLGNGVVSTLQDCFSWFDRNTDGKIGGVSGRSDGRFYDAIYANGQGGVAQDLRLSVTEDLDKSISTRKADDKNGTTRGREKLKFTSVWRESSADNDYPNKTLKIVNTATGALLPITEIQGFNDGDAVYRVVSGVVESYKGRADGDYLYIDPTTSRVDGAFWVIPEQTNISVGDEYNQTDVIGDPANILLTDALKDGWHGSWIPVVPDGSTVNPATRKNVASGSTVPAVYTTNNGTSWNTTNWPYNSVKNEFTAASASQIGILNYTAHCKSTQISTNPVVYRGEDGLGDVFVTTRSNIDMGCILAESLIGKVLTSDHTGGANSVTAESLLLSNLGLDPRYGSLYPTNAYFGYTKHSPLELTPPQNNSPAMKALFATTVVNGLVYPVYYYTELFYQAGSFIPWGDDGLVHIVDNEGTIVDLNYRTMKAGIAIGKDPIGFEQK